MAPAFVRLQRTFQPRQAEVELPSGGAGRIGKRREPSFSHAPGDRLFQGNLIHPDRRLDLSTAKRHAVVACRVEEVGRGEHRLQAHVGPRHGHRGAVGHQGHQRHGHLERIGGEAEMLLGFDVELRGALLAFAQVFQPGQQTLLKVADGADHRPFARLGGVDRHRALVPFGGKGKLNPVTPEAERLALFDEFEIGQLTVEMDQGAQDGREPPGARDAGQ